MNEEELEMVIWGRVDSLPDCWGDLKGPYGGEVSLPHSIDWSPGAHVHDISTYGGAQYAYSAILSEGTLEQVCSLVNGDRLAEMWQHIPLSAQVKSAWEERFPMELHLKIGALRLNSVKRPS